MFKPKQKEYVQLSDQQFQNKTSDTLASFSCKIYNQKNKTYALSWWGRLRRLRENLLLQLVSKTIFYLVVRNGAPIYTSQWSMEYITTVEPRLTEPPKDRGNAFVISTVRYIEILSITVTQAGLKNSLRYIEHLVLKMEVRYMEVSPYNCFYKNLLWRIPKICKHLQRTLAEKMCENNFYRLKYI